MQTVWDDCCVSVCGDSDSFTSYLHSLLLCQESQIDTIKLTLWMSRKLKYYKG